MIVAENCVVSIRFRMTNSCGVVLEDNIDGLAIRYLQGNGEILPALEAELAGLGVKAEKDFTLSTETGYTTVDDQFSIHVIIDEVRIATAEELRDGLFLQRNEDEHCRGEGCC
jgi:FKBP-type peptidyl-prolyl cis-trans isomerase 2